MSPLSQKEIAVQLLGDAPCGFLSTNIQGKVIYANSTLARWLNRDIDWLKDAAQVGDVLTRDSHLYYETQVAPMLRLQGFAREISCKLQVNGHDDRLPVLMNAILREPAKDIPGRVDFAFFDITERLQFDTQLRQARAEAEELAAIVRTATVGILRCDHQGRIRRMNAAAARILNADPETLPDDPVDSILALDKEDPSWFATALGVIEEKGRDFSTDAAAGDTYYNVSVAKIENPEDPFAPAEYSVVLRDITQRVLSEQRLSLMVREMYHRSRNQFAVITGLVRQTLKGVPRERDTLIDRLVNYSASQDILTANHWETANIAELMQIVRKQVGDDSKISFSGPDVQLEPNQFRALSMALHELVTNARKYGALSSDTGTIAVDWTLGGENGDSFKLTWREAGGPAVEEPETSGFGSVMIQQMLAVEFNGTAEISYPPEGLEFVCRGTVKPV